MKRLPQSERVSKSWKNGRGVTEDLVAEVDELTGDFLWRISIASIDRDSAFSEFQGSDRLLMPLSSEGLRLEIDGMSALIPEHHVVAFAGESGVAAVDVRQPGRDLNVMIDRTFGRASLISLAVAERLLVKCRGNETTVVISLAGKLDLGDTILRNNDAILLTAGEAALIKGTGRVAIARLKPLQMI